MLTRREKRIIQHTYGLVRAKDQPQTKALPADMPKKELQKLQEMDEPLAGVCSLVDAPSQLFFR